MDKTAAGTTAPRARPGAKLPEEKIRQRNMAKILEAATPIFARKGFDGTRIAEIAEQAGLPKANVYYYFASKEDIYVAIIRHLLDSWDNALRHITVDADPLTALEAYVREKLEYSRMNADESRLFANEILGGAPFLSEDDRVHMRNITAERVVVVESWIAAGKIKPVDPRHLFIILWSATQFYTDFETLTIDALDKKRLTNHDFADAALTITATVLQGLLPRSDVIDVD